MKKILLVAISLIYLQAFPQGHMQKGLFKLSEVQLLEGPFKHAQELNIDVLLQYDTDRLLEPFLTEAGITPKGARYSNWDGLSGHVGGHYLSAMAMHYAATGSAECKSRMEYIISELKACQDANGNGYLGGIPNGESMWQALKSGNLSPYRSAWVPWYNVHKTFAGLRDAYVYGGSETAKQMFLDLCDWGIDITAGLSSSTIQSMLDVEFGGMNEVYADAYQITGDKKYLDQAKLFTHNYFYANFINNRDVLDNQHANTQIPKFIGFERVFQVDPSAESYGNSARNFWQRVVNERSLALGGNSRSEHFPSKAASEEYITHREGPETCNTYNMLKLTGDLFNDDPKVEYVDFYERALFNHILSSQHPGHGGYVYFTPARPRHYRVYSQPNQAMWCCVGSGMENPGLHQKFIYAHSGDSLYLNLIIASQLNWEEKGIQLTQETDFPYSDSTRLTLQLSESKNFSLMVRYPSWVKAEELEVQVNDDALEIDGNPGEFVEINRQWNDGDIIHIKTPMYTHFEEMPNVPEYIALLHGPVLLGAKTGTKNLDGLVADNGRWSHIASGQLRSLYEAPIIVGDRDTILQHIKPVEGSPLHFTATGLFKEQENYADLVIEPFSGIHDARYMMYWLSLSDVEYETILEELRKEEEEKLILDNRTVDQVATGEQQPEADHNFKGSNSNSGIHMNEYWRDANNGGYFSYEMATGGNKGLSLFVRYWGNEGGARTFDIRIDDTIIAIENVTGKWNVNDFVNVEYPIPDNLVEGKDFINVRFQGHPGNIAGGVFYLHLLKELNTSAPDVHSDREENPILFRDGVLSLKNGAKYNRPVVKIYNLQGVLVYRNELNDGRINLNSAGLSGVYIVSCKLDNSYFAKKIAVIP